MGMHTLAMADPYSGLMLRPYRALIDCQAHGSAPNAYHTQVLAAAVLCLHQFAASIKSVPWSAVARAFMHRNINTPSFVIDVGDTWPPDGW